MRLHLHLENSTPVLGAEHRRRTSAPNIGAEQWRRTSAPEMNTLISMSYSNHESSRVQGHAQPLEAMQELDNIIRMAAEDIQDIVNGRRDIAFASIYNRQYTCVLYGYGDKLYSVVKSAIRRTALSRNREEFHSTLYVIESVSSYLDNIFLPKHELPSLLEYAENVWHRPVSLRWRKVCNAVRKLPFIKRMRLLFDESRLRPGCSGMVECQKHFKKFLH